MAYIRSNVRKINANVFMVEVTRLIDNITLEVTFNPNGSAADIQNAVVQTFTQYDSDIAQIAEITTEIDSVLASLG